ncbi:uncharacterized protein SEPMUDRAFT_124973 [Sphaerulina musiva SO2202]|uniref:Uncharacterized protein n=1 Tax=Sphaerulina musiva (strain SO2202) TaxID=692275 RepID=M3D5F2_SPHMS|nr:uncharacterized protein SEPMUDRAFT_124973 [Sphaerulina musiva SO2202]EMF13114.1 hypothetical protein SEPMUDRAFT_124973 [Sphaerulina musiva SO2202]
MHAPNAVRLRVVTTIFLALGAVPTLAQYVENFTGSLQIVNGQGTYSGTSSGGSGGWSESGSPAVQAQCPANFPVTCSSIQKPDYCCPANNYCAWQDSVVACCPNGKVCSGFAQPITTVWQQQPPATVVVVGAPSKPEGYFGQYCKTLVAVGPGLPTTEAGDCGTILIVEGDAIRATVINWIYAIGMVVGLQILGGLVFMRR